MFKPSRHYENDQNVNKMDDLDKPNMDFEIKHPKIRIIDDAGVNLGVFSVKEGIAKAK